MPTNNLKLRYHINYDNGYPDVCFDLRCKAPKRDHFDTFAAAQAAYDELQEYMWPSFSKKAGRIPLADISAMRELSA